MGAPEVEAVIRTDGMPLPDGIPLCYIKSAPWLVDVDASTREIRLFDFGGSRAQAHHAPKLNQPIPEMIFTNNHDCSIDSWLAGSVVSDFIIYLLNLTCCEITDDSVRYRYISSYHCISPSRIFKATLTVLST